ncbi:acylphosphatase [Sulfurimonas sp. CS5]|jgi:acylphosphatase|uniref:acylphosphatase n=1 Tax=Sulfurimonas sp. CS5 TaxID=3391145 RepID=UPI0039ED407A
MKNYKFKITGKVQGVYYRANVQKKALSAGYSGYVKNKPDGSVEACVTCHSSKLEYFTNLLKQGSQYSKVDSVERQEIEELFKGDFEIR